MPIFISSFLYEIPPAIRILPNSGDNNSKRRSAVAPCPGGGCQLREWLTILSPDGYGYDSEAERGNEKVMIPQQKAETTTYDPEAKDDESETKSNKVQLLISKFDDDSEAKDDDSYMHI